MNRPDPIRTDSTNPFARDTVANRLRNMLDAIPASGTTKARLDELRDGIRNDAPLTMFQLPAPDYEWWYERFFAHASRIRAATGKPPSPHNAEWFFFEHYLFRQIIEAVDWWSSGFDPFGHVKQAELHDSATWQRLSKALQAGNSAADPLYEHIQFCLWGNRVDLSYSEVAQAADNTSNENAIIADDYPEARPLLEGGNIQFICDNAGTELAADLALTDYLLERTAQSVILHVKLHPTYVSDTTASDVHATIAAMQRRVEQSIVELGGRLERAVSRRRLRIAPDQYWNGPDFFEALPDRLKETLGPANLVVVKGDMNYRRVLGDSIPVATTPVREVADALPAPALLVRTMKGDPVAGLDKDKLEELNAEDPHWRTNGKRGVIQLV